MAETLVYPARERGVVSHSLFLLASIPLPSPTVSVDVTFKLLLQTADELNDNRKLLIAKLDAALFRFDTIMDKLVRRRKLPMLYTNPKAEPLRL